MDVESRGKKRRMSAGGTAFSKKSKTQVSTAIVKRAIHQQSEMKYYDTFVDAVAIPAGTNGGAVPLSPPNGIVTPATGATAATRVGNQIFLSRLRVRGKIYFAAAALTALGLNAANIRLCLIRDKEPTPGVALVAGDVFTNAAATINGSCMALMNVQNLGRFEILKDKSIVLQDPNLQTTGTNGRSVQFKIEHRFKQPIKVRFNATSASPVTDIFHIMAFSETGATFIVPLISYQSRACFKED